VIPAHKYFMIFGGFFRVWVAFLDLFLIKGSILIFVPFYTFIILSHMVSFACMIRMSFSFRAPMVHPLSQTCSHCRLPFRPFTPKPSVSPTLDSQILSSLTLILGEPSALVYTSWSSKDLSRFYFFLQCRIPHKIFPLGTGPQFSEFPLFPLLFSTSGFAFEQCSFAVLNYCPCFSLPESDSFSACNFAHHLLAIQSLGQCKASTCEPPFQPFLLVLWHTPQSCKMMFLCGSFDLWAALPPMRTALLPLSSFLDFSALLYV